MREKRYKLITVTSEALGLFFNTPTKLGSMRAVPEVPVDIELVNVRHGVPNQIEIIVYHPSFDIVPDLEPIPSFDIQYIYP